MGSSRSPSPPIPPRPSVEVLTQFGIQPRDEQAHPFDADDPTWNESIFYDFVQRDGTAAGHIRIGAMPGQERVWLWIYLFDGERWLGLDEGRLPIANFDWERFAYEGPGLSFSREVGEALVENRVRANGFARVLSGPGAGGFERVELDLQVYGVGPCHGVGDTGEEGHSHDELSAARFEQPTVVHGKLGVGERVIALDARGERDHSWGPRYWNMTWRFLVLSREGVRLQVAAVSFEPDVGDDDTGEDDLVVGYLHTGQGDEAKTSEADEVRFALTYDDASPLAPFRGHVSITYEDGSAVAGRIEPLGGTAIDACHAFSPPQPSVYRRALVEMHPDDGSETYVGWLEINRFPAGMHEEHEGEADVEDRA